MTRWMIGLLAATLLVGCKKKEGDSCDGTALVCADESTVLSCDEGSFVAVSCKGAEGCKKKGDTTVCDVSGNADGDSCTTTLDNSGRCSADGKNLIVCHKGAFRAIPCRGKKGCADSECDMSAAEIGDQCRKDDGFLCGVDKKTQVKCVIPKGAPVGKYQLHRPCRGPKACRIDGDKVRCDVSLGKVGDFCTSGASCNMEKTAMLKCQDAKLAIDTPCRGEKGCRSEGDKIRCDRSRGEVGDPCGSGGACSVDGKQLLTCKEGKLVVRRNCYYRRCTVKGTTVSCR